MRYEAFKTGPTRSRAKLDNPGTQGWFEKVNGTALNLRHIVRNIAACATRFEVTIQSLFPTMDSQPATKRLGRISGDFWRY